MPANFSNPTKDKVQNYIYWLQERGIRYIPVSSENHEELEPSDLPPQNKEFIEAEPLKRFTHVDSIRCNKCSLHLSRPGASWGSGSSDAKAFFIGDYPSREAASIGKPFAGPELELLNNIQKAMRLTTKDWYLMNLIQCPITKEDGITKHYKICQKFITSQIKLIKPKILVFLGEATANLLMDAEQSSTFGRISSWGPYASIVIHHPRELLLQPTLKRVSWEALQKAIQYLEN